MIFKIFFIFFPQITYQNLINIKNGPNSIYSENSVMRSFDNMSSIDHGTHDLAIIQDFKEAIVGVVQNNLDEIKNKCADLAINGKEMLNDGISNTVISGNEGIKKSIAKTLSEKITEIPASAVVSLDDGPRLSNGVASSGNNKHPSDVDKDTDLDVLGEAINIKNEQNSGKQNTESSDQNGKTSKNMGESIIGGQVEQKEDNNNDGKVKNIIVESPAQSKNKTGKDTESDMDYSRNQGDVKIDGGPPAQQETKPIIEQKPVTLPGTLPEKTVDWSNVNEEDLKAAMEMDNQQVKNAVETEINAQNQQIKDGIVTELCDLKQTITTEISKILGDLHFTIANSIVEPSK